MKKATKIPKINHIQGFIRDSSVYWHDIPARILVVDDEEGVTEALKEFFKSLGYQAFGCGDPHQALEVIKDQFIHLVILDLRLPGMDGIELQQRICELSPDTMQIIITGYETVDSAIKTLRAGAYDYLTKPIRLPYLENVVRNCLEKKRLELDNRLLFGELSQTCEQLKEREYALEAKTQEANYYLHNILEKANDIIFTLDLEGHFTYVNPKIEALGYDRDSLIGSSFCSLLSEKQEAASVYRWIKMGRPKECEISVRDFLGTRRQMILSISPIHDSGHVLTGALAIAMDITDKESLIAKLKETQELVEVQKKDYALEQERSSEEIRLLQEYNHRILSGIPVGVALFDKEGKTLQANMRFMDLFSIHPEKVINYPISAYLPPDVLKEIAPKMSKAAHKASAYESIKVCLKEDQAQEIILGLRIVPLTDHKGEVENILLLTEDLTRSKNMERELLRLEKVNSMLQLATGVAHEVRNPLSIILGSIQYLRSIVGDSNRAIMEHLNVVADSCGLLESIINELLNFARHSSLVFRSMDINACLERTVSLLKRQCQSQSVDVLLDLDPDLPLTACDEQHIGQVFINLIMNAVQAMPEGGELRITTKNEPLHKRVLVRFQDTGKGIDPADLDRIFEPFFSTKSKGIGLGLAVTKRIIEDHYGKIWATTQMGYGAEFYIQLPYRYQGSKG